MSQTTPEDKNSTKPALSPKILLAVSLAGIALVGALFYQLREPKMESVETVVTEEKSTPENLNLSQVINAVNDRSIVAKEGWRYEVIIQDESDDGVAGVTRIGGLVTFVPEARPGERVVIEVTRIKERTANAVVVQRLEKMAPPPKREASTSRQPASEERRSASRLEIGSIHEGMVSDLGKKGDGIVKVKGKVVFIPGVNKGDQIRFRVTADEGRVARGEVVEASTALSGEVSVAESPAPRQEKADPADAVVEGALFEVEVTDKSRKNPETEGIARIGGLIVFVQGGQPGDKVRIRITERKERAAVAEIVEKLVEAPQ